MGKKSGYILLHRSLLEHWVYQEKPFSKGQAWIDLLLLANYEDKKTYFRGKLVTCKRGTVNLSIQELSKRWGWNWRTTKNFILSLERESMCILECTRECTTITIVKYDDFQTFEKRNTKRNTNRNAERNTEAVQNGIQNGVQNGIQITKEYKNNVKEEKEKPAALPSEDPDDGYPRVVLEEDEMDGPWYTGEELLEMSEKGLI